MEIKNEFIWKDGKPYCDGNLNLRYTATTSLPDNLVVEGWLDLEGCKSLTSLPNNLVVGDCLFLRDCKSLTSLPDNLVVGGGLDLSGTLITSLPDNLIVKGWLELEGCKSLTSLPDNLVVEGWLDLEGCNSLASLPDNLVVGSSLFLEGCPIKALPDNLVVGNNLYLSDTAITSLPDSLVVGHNLYLNDTAITSLPNNLVVGGSLDLEGCKSLTSLPDNLVVGGSLYLQDTAITSLPDSFVVGYCIHNNNGFKWSKPTPTELQAHIDNVRNNPFIWECNGQKYIKIDGIFSILDNHHGNVYHTHKIGRNKTVYIVTDGERHWAHGYSLAEAKADLIYKVSDRDTSKYKSMTLDDMLSFEEAIAAYRSITGACSLGTRDYIENRLPQPRKDKYTIREIIELTEGEYGGKRFKEFFSMNK